MDIIEWGGRIISTRKIITIGISFLYLLGLLIGLSSMRNSEMSKMELNSKGAMQVEKSLSPLNQAVEAESVPQNPEQSAQQSEPKEAIQEQMTTSSFSGPTPVAYPLFKVTVKPEIPSYLSEGNYVIQMTSPHKDKVAYLYPDEWETIGEIYIKDLLNNSWTKLSLNQDIRKKMWNKSETSTMAYTPKKRILWLDNDTFLTLVGYAYGTISTGGDLVKVKTSTGEAEMLYPAYATANREVTDIETTTTSLRIVVTTLDAKGLHPKNEVITAPLNKLEELREIKP